jgi:acyl-CoA thioester hydrolase
MENYASFVVPMRKFISLILFTRLTQNDLFRLRHLKCQAKAQTIMGLRHQPKEVSMPDQEIKTEMEVRDYECDMEGIVNNAVYMNYIEHARHAFLKSKGLNFNALVKSGIRLVVIRIEADYVFPLRSGDRFYVATTVERISKLRFGFRQHIHLLSDEKLILRANVIGTSLDESGRPKYFEAIEKLF